MMTQMVVAADAADDDDDSPSPPPSQSDLESIDTRFSGSTRIGASDDGSGERSRRDSDIRRDTKDTKSY